MQKRYRGAKMHVQRCMCRGAEGCRGADKVLRGAGAEVLKRCRCRGAEEVQKRCRFRGAEVQVQRCREVQVKSCRVAELHCWCTY